MSTSYIIFGTSNQCADVDAAWRRALSILWIEFPFGNKYLMNQDQRLIEIFFWYHTKEGKCPLTDGFCKYIFDNLSIIYKFDVKP